MNALRHLHAAQERLHALRQELEHAQRRAAELAQAVDCEELARTHAVGGFIHLGAGTLHQLGALRLKAEVLERAVAQQRDAVAASQQRLLDEQLGADARQRQRLLGELRHTCERFAALLTQLDEVDPPLVGASAEPAALRIVSPGDDEPSGDPLREAS
jgi:hypothetical protein